MNGYKPNRAYTASEVRRIKKKHNEMTNRLVNGYVNSNSTVESEMSDKLIELNDEVQKFSENLTLEESKVFKRLCCKLTHLYIDDL